MTSLKSAKLQLQSDTPQTLNNLTSEPHHNISDELSQNYDSDQENQRIVNLLFPQKKAKRPYMNDQTHVEEDSDIKGFLEEQIPGLYRDNTNDEIYDDSSQEESPDNFPLNDDDHYINYSISTGPGYLNMSKFQRLSYFESLNAIYASRMRVPEGKKNAKQHFNKQDPEQRQQAEQNKKDKNKKPAIKFNQIVCEVPFNKDQQPIVVRDTPEEEAFIVFDDEAYEEDFEAQEQQEERLAREMLQNKKIRHFQKTKVYIDDQDDSDSPQTLYNIERMHFLNELEQIQKYNGQSLDDGEDEHVFFTDSEDELLDFDDEEDDWPSEDEDSFDQQFKENHPKKENKKIVIERQHDSKGREQPRKSWKRNHQREFLEDQQDENDDEQSGSAQLSSSGSSQGSSDNSEDQESSDKQESPENVSPNAESQNSKERTVSQESQQFQEGIKGRKINPNHQVKQFPPNQPGEAPLQIVTENNQILQTPLKNQQEQICQNTSEGQAAIE